MAFRIGDYVLRGEIDNRARDRVTGWIMLAGADEPCRLELQGNCHRDLAGRLFTFVRKRESPGPAAAFPATEQNGAVGDMTASRKAKVFLIPVEEALARIRAGIDIEMTLANTLYLEWFSQRNGLGAHGRSARRKYSRAQVRCL